MISDMKRITVHGVATHLDLLAFKFNNRDDKLLDHAGFGEHDYVGILRIGPSCQFYFDNKNGYALSATKADDYVLNSAVQEILSHYESIPTEAHIEVNREGEAALLTGLQFK